MHTEEESAGRQAGEPAGIPAVVLSRKILQLRDGGKALLGRILTIATALADGTGDDGVVGHLLRAKDALNRGRRA